MEKGKCKVGIIFGYVNLYICINLFDKKLKIVIEYFCILSYYLDFESCIQLGSMQDFYSIFYCRWNKIYLFVK